MPLRDIQTVASNRDSVLLGWHPIARLTGCSEERSSRGSVSLRAPFSRGYLRVGYIATLFGEPFLLSSEVRFSLYIEYAK